MKILADVPSARRLSDLLNEAHRNYGHSAPVVNPAWQPLVGEFLIEREAHLFERRGYRADEARAVALHWEHPHLALARIEALSQNRGSDDFVALAALLKRVNNITKDFQTTAGIGELRGRLREPSELALVDAAARIWPTLQLALAEGRYADAMKDVVTLRQPVDRFFVDVMVMTEEPALRDARLTLLATLKKAILNIADIAEMATETQSG